MAELGVPVHEYNGAALQWTIETGQVSGNLHHPPLVRTGRAAGEVDAARLQFHYEQILYFLQRLLL